MPRIVEEFCSDTVAFTSHATGLTLRDGNAVGFAESSGRIRISSGDIAVDGTIKHSLSGKASTGEQGTLDTCHMLAQKLNIGGASWQEVVLSELPHTDAMLRVEAGSDLNALRVQVVRAVVDPAFWIKLSKTGSTYATEVTVEEAANLVFAAIKLKAEKIPASKRGEVLLALNAIETPFVCFPQALAFLIEQYRNEIEEFGFLSIWVVGSQPELVSRLNA